MATWTIDHSHSEVNFKVRHMLVSNVRGNFGSYSATIEAADENFSDAVIRFEAAIDSINTGNEQRDGHLKSPDFFNAASHPTMTFASRTVSVVSAHEMKVEGDLTIRGVTKPITLDVIYNGTVSGFGGVEIAGFEITGTINRFDYGLEWNALTEAGGMVVGSDVKIEIVAEFNRA